MAELGALAKLMQLLKSEAPAQQEAARAALARAAAMNREQSVVGPAMSGPPGRITSGSSHQVYPDMRDVTRARRALGPAFDFHTHPVEGEFGVTPSSDDLSYYAGNYADRPGPFGPLAFRSLIASPPERGNVGDTARAAYHFFETHDPAKVFNSKLAGAAKFDAQRAAQNGRFSSVLDGPGFSDFQDYGGDVGDLIGDMSNLVYLKLQADKGLGRQRIGLSGKLVVPGLTNLDAYNQLEGPMLDFLRERKFRRGGRVGALGRLV